MLKGTLLIFLAAGLLGWRAATRCRNEDPFNSGLRHGLRRHAFGLLEPDQQVRWLDLGMAHVAGSVLCQDDDPTGLGGEPLEHNDSLCTMSSPYQIAGCPTVARRRW